MSLSLLILNFNIKAPCPGVLFFFQIMWIIQLQRYSPASKKVYYTYLQKGSTGIGLYGDKETAKEFDTPDEARNFIFRNFGKFNKKYKIVLK